MQLSKKICGSVFGFAAFLMVSSVVRADAVTDWNAITVQTIVNAGPSHSSAVSFLDSATVQVAVYDAVVAIDGRFKPYHVQIPGASGSPAAAVAAAAHDVLVNRFPSQAGALDMVYSDYLNTHNLMGNPGIAVGQQAAAGIIALRANDGSFPVNQPPFTGGSEPGVWRPTPEYLPSAPPLPFQPALAPWLANVTPFTLTSPSQFRPVGPPPLNSNRYAEAYNEVKAMGARFNSARTAEQTDLALFWNSNYLVLWNHALRDIAAAHITNLDDSARLFALANLAGIDAGITAWDSKFRYVSWRPVTAIQERDNDGNPDTMGDPSWQPLINTPNYPEYTSGANNVTAAITRIRAFFFGTEHLTFSVATTNAAALQQTRTYDRFSDVTTDVVNARIYEGIHFRPADEQARKQGRHVAQWVFSHFLRPIGDKEDENGDDTE